MTGLLKRRIILVGAVVLLPLGCGKDRRFPGASTPGTTTTPPPVVIPRDWKQQPPFDQRFDEDVPGLVIDLAATRFGAVTLNGPTGPSFSSPKNDAFDPELIRDAFAYTNLDLFIVQSKTPSDQQTLRSKLDDRLLPVRGYIPDQAYLVWLDPTAFADLAAQPEVSWIGLMQPAWRIAPTLDYLLEYSEPRLLTFTAIFDPAFYASRDEVFRAAAESGFWVLDWAQRKRNWKVRLQGSTADVRQLARLPGCRWIERFAGYRLHNNVARTSVDTATGRGSPDGPIMDVEDVWARGIRGEGQIAAAADTGLSTGNLSTLHIDFGEQGSGTNPLRVIAGFALGRATWDDDQSINGGHGTHVSGSIVGNGVRSGSAPSTNSFPTTCYAGTAPKAQYVFQSVMDSGGGLGGVPSDLNVLFQQAYDAGARVHSNSWGAPTAGIYDTEAQDVDQFLWDHPEMVILFSAGNAGTDGQAQSSFPPGGCAATGDPIDGVIDTDAIDSPATAKSCLAIGASENYRPTFVYEYPAGDCTSSDGDEQMSWGWFSSCSFSVAPVLTDPLADNANGLAAFSSRGPADDGRIKPELAAPGIAIISTRTDVNQAYEQWGVCAVPSEWESYYMAMGGTSMATPLAAGVATLVRQYYVDGWHADGSRETNSTATPADGFEPTSALVRATLINGAWDMTPGQYGTGATRELPPNWDTGADLPNNAEGFGRIDLEAALFPGSGFGQDSARKMEVHDVAAGLTQGSTQDFQVSVGSSDAPLVVTLVWTDPYADTSAGTALVNDLDLTAAAPDGSTIYYPNGIDRTSGGDTLNPIEQIKVTAPQVGDWTLTVTATSVPGNGETDTNIQPYALAISGVLVPPCTIPDTPTNLSASPNGDNRIDLTWDAVAADSYRVYRATSSGGPYDLLAENLVSPSFNDTVGLTGGVTYYYVVTAFNESDCESTQSTESSAEATGGCGDLPTFGGVTSVSAITDGSCVVRVAWSAGTNNCGSTPLVYNVYRSTTSGFTVGPTTLLQSCVAGTAFDDSTVNDGQTYYYVVRAEDHLSSMGGPCRGGNEETNTIELSGAPSGPSGLTALYEHDFETGSGLDDWGTGFFGGNEVMEWRGIQACAPTQSGTHIFRFGGTGCTDDYGQSRFQFAQPASATGITAAADTSDTTLRFWHRWELESGNKDGGFLTVSLNSNDYTLVPASAVISGATYNDMTGSQGTIPAFSGTQATMVETVVDLDPVCDTISGGSDGCAGHTFWVAFGVYTTNGQHRDGWFLDDVQITVNAPTSCSGSADPVTFLTATAGNTQNRIEWQNPAANYGATLIRVRTDDYPSSATDGTLVVQKAGTAGAYDSIVHDSLSNGTRYYYAAFVNNGSGVFSSRRTVTAQPVDTSGPIQWVYATGASSLAPPGIGSVFAVSNDRVLHAMEAGSDGGYWPSNWTPLTMNGAATARPTVVPLSIGGASKVVFVSSLDGHVYAVNGVTGGPVWGTPPDLGAPLVAAPAGIFSAYGGSYDQILVGTRDSSGANQLYALNVTTGAVLGSFDNGGGASAIGIISGTPTVDYTTSRVYFASRQKSGGSANTAWCVTLTGSNPTACWQVDVGSSDCGPTLAGGRLYLGNNDGEVYALNPSDGAAFWGAPFATNDGPVKEMVWVSGSDFIFSTTDKVWSVADNGGSTDQNWVVTSIPGPSAPLVVPGTSRALVGGSNGRLYQIDFGSGTPTVTSVLLESDGATMGGPALDVVERLIHVGSEGGNVFAVTDPLP